VKCPKFREISDEYSQKLRRVSGHCPAQEGEGEEDQKKNPPPHPPAADEDFLVEVKKRLTRPLSEQEVADLRELSKEPGFLDAVAKLNGSVHAPLPFLRVVLGKDSPRHSSSSGSRKKKDEKPIPYACPDCGQLVESQFERCKRCYPPENVFAHVGTNGNNGTG
jgi:predicted RNA-binding Zn-ribbon protein involved in translation (DUF1610 family)